MRISWLILQRRLPRRSVLVGRTGAESFVEFPFIGFTGKPISLSPFPMQFIDWEQDIWPRLKTHREEVPGE